MDFFYYSLEKSEYSWKNALFWGNFAGHCRKLSEGSLGDRLVHALIAFVELIPILSQISSIFEKIIVDNFSKIRIDRSFLIERKCSSGCVSLNDGRISGVYSLVNESGKCIRPPRQKVKENSNQQRGVSNNLEANSGGVLRSDANELASRLNFQYRPGQHTLKSPVVGSRASELAAVKSAMKTESVLRRLQEAIYQGHFIYLIPNTKKDESDEVARELFLDYISKYSEYGCNEQNIVDWAYSGSPGCASNKAHIYDIENEWNTWRVAAIVEARHGDNNEQYGKYLPPHVVAYHELMHVEEIPLGARETFQGENGNELLTVVKTFILLDSVYKKIHGLDEAFEVDYGKYIEISGNKINLGRFANFYREKERKFDKLYLALISQESIKFLKGEIQKDW